jgi:hypothetical protein
MSFCATVADAFFIWTRAAPVSDPVHSNAALFQIRVSRLDSRSVEFSIHHKMELLSQTIHEVEANVMELCVTVLSGRGFVGTFLKSRDEKQQIVAIHELSIPRESYFECHILGACNISGLCMGDYLGVPRHEIHIDNQWSSTVRDFL